MYRTLEECDAAIVRCRIRTEDAISRAFNECLHQDGDLTTQERADAGVVDHRRLVKARKVSVHDPEEVMG
jgi:hypothetical protein